MMIPNRLLICLAVFGMIAAALLWGFGIVPWWALPFVIIAAPILGCVILTLLFYALWIASGSH
jgi:hypothetical protein